MNVSDLRRKYLEFFLSKGHQQHASGSLIPYDVTGKLDESLLFNGAGMVQFKPYFRGVAEPPSKRLTNAQKCVRTGDIEAVGDLSHLTFFEMLGNFSFGDYFKKEAIAYSWEFLTSPQWLGLDPNRLSFTVFEEDDVAFECWSEHLHTVNIDPSTRVFRLGEETNYWPAGAFSSGPPGPCGPNSEMFYWVAKTPPPSGTYSREDWLKDDEAKNWLEIWNDVFIQYEWKGRHKDPSKPNLGYEKEGLDNLPFQSVDTGMGLERTAAVLGGFASVYDTDAFTPILRKIEAVGTTPVAYGADPAKDTAIRIIADHIRTACFCIADGILPSNTGRGYVLRRLIRRAVLKGQRVLGFEDLFLFKVYEGVVDALGDHYAELSERKDVIVETLKNEEALFRRTLDSGYEEFMDVLRQDVALRGLVQQREDLGLEHSGTIVPTGPLERLLLGPSSYRSLVKRNDRLDMFPGRAAFMLYDTFGFPLEVTQELAEEAGLTVDLDGYEAALREAQERSRGSSDMDAVYAADDRLVVSAEYAVPTRFMGYEHMEWDADIVRVSPIFGADGKTTGDLLLALDQTPFYAESGGQVGDAGTLETSLGTLSVRGTRKESGTFWHETTLESMKGLGREEAEAKAKGLLVPVKARVDHVRRRRITRHHSATHLLHHALRKVLGKHVTQAGSLVHPDHLRFDFTHGKAMTPAEISEVERLVNEMALNGDDVAIKAEVPIGEAKEMGAMALFGEKYGDKVRVVRMGESIELCGGCHVRHTSEVGLFKIVSEASAASGVRRIEAVAGEAAYAWAKVMDSQAREAAELLKASPTTLIPAIHRTMDAAKEERRKREKAEAALVNSGGNTASGDGARIPVGPLELWTPTFDGLDQRTVATAIDQAVAQSPRLVVVAAVTHEGKLTFIAKAGSEAVASGAHAGNLVREVAKVAGGGGGGKPDYATAGAKDPAKVGEALAIAQAFLQSQFPS